MDRRSHPHRPRPLRSLASASFCALLLIGCTATGAGTTAPGNPSPASVTAGAPSGTGQDAASTQRGSAVEVDDGARLDTGGTLVELRQTPDVVSAAAGREVAAVLTDLETFWAGQLDGAFRTPAGGYLLTDTAGADPTSSSTSTGQAAPSAGPRADNGCAASAQSLRGNAFYCPARDLIVVDAGALVPVLRSSYGIGGLAAALAHEYGHLVQARIGPTSAQQREDPQRYPQVLVEAQADCAAGAYLAWTSGHGTAPGTPRLRLPPAALPRSISPLVDFRDSATSATTDLFHGYGLDRLRAVVRGYEQGTRSCAAMTVGELDLTLGRKGTTIPGTQERYPDGSAVATAATAALVRFDPGARGIAVAASATDLSAAQEIGQFAQGSATVLAVGRERFPAAADCYLGAFTGARYGRAPAGTLGAWRSDADEAMDLVIGRSVGSAAGWAQIAGFVRGFDGGLSSCR